MKGPIVPGFHPDPSVCGVGDDYYLACSSFEYFPGLPLFHSRDLVSWEPIGHVAERPGQLALEDVPTLGGCWAPTIRFHDGRFWVVVTDAMGRGSLIFTAEKPEGPWSDGIVMQGVDGIDPDIAWDAGGVCYVTYSGLKLGGDRVGEHQGIQQVRMDPETGRALEEPRSLWSGTGLMFPEAPHLYEIDGAWYLMIAEGGTERGHAVSIARGPRPDGPFEGCPGNPVLSARSTDRPVQNTGHADLVRTPDGGWAMVMLGMRTGGMTRAFSPMGRETFITPVDWVDGWPVPQPVQPGPGIGPVKVRDDFDAPVLGPEWISIRTPAEGWSSLTERPGSLLLHGDVSSMDDPRPRFVGRRQQHRTASFSASVDAGEGVGGLSLRIDEEHHYDIEAGPGFVRARARIGQLSQTWEQSVGAGAVVLRIEVRPAPGPRALGPDTVVLCADDAELIALDGRYVSAETAAAFTGRVVGMYATVGRVAFDWFAYEGDDAANRETWEEHMSDERELTGRVAALSLEQKVRLLTGADFWTLYPEPAVGLRRVVVSDGPAGVRGERWDERYTSANVPSPTALAATWDERRVERLGELLAYEARRKGVDVLLAPTVNLHRSPYGGRHFECFSEDPLLTARTGVAYVRGVQGGGVGATVKHFVANDSETERMSLDVRVDERTLRELYLAPFEAIVREAGVWAVMASYNSVNGFSMTESPLLREILHEEWGFDGLVMTDWTAARSTVPTGRAALDLVMPGPNGPWGDALVAAVREGKVDESAVDDKVLRLLRLAARVGALEGAPKSAATRVHDEATVAAELRATAAAGFVLARNEGAVLPLDPSSLTRVAVVGPNAIAGRTLGGGSATVFPPYVISPVDGIRAALGDSVQVTCAPGALGHTRIPVAGAPWLRLPDGTGAGVQVRFRAADGTVLASENRPGCAFTWMGSFGPGVPKERVAQVEVHTVLRATEPGSYEIGGSGIGRYRLSVGGTEVFDEVLALPPGADVVEGLVIPPQRAHTVRLEADEETELVLTHDVGSAGGDLSHLATMFQLNLRPPHGTDAEELERAVAAARDADVAVVVVGTTEEVESEGFDRTSLALPGRQDELVRQVAAVNPRTIVVVNAGAPVLLPWADEVAAVLLAWFPGQEFGNALADVLTGRAEPGGRLPTTWPATENELPSTHPVGGVLPYKEGLLLGHRGGARGALYPFGHGLGYTTWDYLDVSSSGDGVEVRLRNTGARRGQEIVQVYASRGDSAIERPVRWLVGFAVAEADPGEEVTVAVAVRDRAFEHWDAAGRRWATEPGVFRLHAGSSSAVLPLVVEVRK